MFVTGVKGIKVVSDQEIRGRVEQDNIGRNYATDLGVQENNITDN
jgi:hypothetical protein